MIYTDKTKQALKLSFEAHKEQLDKSGMPYVFHPFHLAEQMDDEMCTIAALLHDVVEDTDYTLNDLKDMGIPDQVIKALTLLTHDDSEPYMEYVCRVSCNPIAKAVKLADLDHNSDLNRLQEIREKDKKRVAKYGVAKQLLNGSYSDSHNSEISYCKIKLNPEKDIYFTVKTTEKEIIEYNVSIEKEEKTRLTFSIAESHKISDFLEQGISFPQQLIKYFEEHSFQDFHDFLIKNKINCFDVK